MTSEAAITRIRSLLLGLVGLCCLTYALMALVQNRSDPFLWYLPYLAGLIATVLIFVAFVRADRATRGAASDELYKTIARSAACYAYWIAVAMYPVFGLGVAVLDLRWDTVFAVMGALTGASYLLLLTFLEWRTG